MNSYYYEHIPFYINPVLFILCWSYTTFRHWRDGKEGSKFYASRIILKILACLFISILEFLHIVFLTPSNYYILKEKLFRLCYFALSSFAWLLSGYLVYFEYKRRIKPKIFGQRGFWVLSLGATSALLTLNVLEDNFIESTQAVRDFYLYQTIIYGFSVCIEMFLAYYAVFKPNDFFIDKIPIDHLDPLNEYEEERERLEELEVTSAGYKVKTVNGVQIVFFEVFVTVGTSSKKVSRTLPEFEILHSELEKKFYTEFTGFGLTNNPKTLISAGMEERVTGLTEYLSRLCAEKLYTQELLDFLEVPAKLQDDLRAIFHRTYEASNLDVLIRARSEIDNYFTPKNYNNEALAISLPAYHLNWMIDVQIPSWTRTDKHIEYSIKSEIRLHSFESWLNSRYSELLTLHKTLSKLHIPVPNFPSKHLTHFKSKDSDSISIRRAQLEEYLSFIYNDPAYLHTNSLKFINCPLDLSTILAMVPKNTHYSLIPPVKWESDIGNDSSQYIAYVLKFSKEILNKSQDWEVTRRFREFVSLHKTLTQRHSSLLLEEFLGTVPTALPCLPSRSLTPLCTCDEIEDRRVALEGYLNDLLKNPAVTCCYAFRMFIGEIE